MVERKRIRCAIYTRKSSEEGLEQDFNSLDAQREACEAYVLSQKHEGGPRYRNVMTMAASPAATWSGPVSFAFWTTSVPSGSM